MRRQRPPLRPPGTAGHQSRTAATPRTCRTKARRRRPRTRPQRPPPRPRPRRPAQGRRETPLQQEAPVAEESAAVHHKHHHKEPSADDDEAPPPPPKSNSPFVEAIAKRREKEDDSPTTPQPKARQGDKPVGRPYRPDPTPSPSPELEELTPFAARRRSLGASPTPTRRFLRRESSFSFDPGDVSSPRRRHSASLGQMRHAVRLAGGGHDSVEAVVVRRRRRRLFEGQLISLRKLVGDSYLRRPPPRRPRERPDDSTGTAGAGPRAIIAAVGFADFPEGPRTSAPWWAHQTRAKALGFRALDMSHVAKACREISRSAWRSSCAQDASNLWSLMNCSRSSSKDPPAVFAAAFAARARAPPISGARAPPPPPRRTRLGASARAAGERLRSRAARSRMMVRPMAKPRRRRRRAAPREPSAAAGESHLNQARRARAAMPQNPPAARRSSLETAAAAARVEHHLTKTAGPLLKEGVLRRRCQARRRRRRRAGAGAGGGRPQRRHYPTGVRRPQAMSVKSRSEQSFNVYLGRGPRPALMFRRRPRLSRAYPKASSPPGAGCSSFVKVR